MTLLIAHRGASDQAPENTLKAFRIALNEGFNMLECDVYMTSDSELVVLHDAMLERHTNGRGYVSDHSLAQLRRLDAGDGQKIPLLSEVVDLVIARDARLIIEVKAGSEAMAEHTFRRLITYLLNLPRTILSRIEIHSFWYHALPMASRSLPEMKTAVIVNGGFSGAEIADLAHRVGASGVSIGYEYIDPKVVRACRRRGLFVDSWLEDDRTTYTRLKGLRLHGLIGGVLLRRARH